MEPDVKSPSEVEAMSPLKQLQRLKESGSIRLSPGHRYGTGRRRKSGGSFLDTSFDDASLKHQELLKNGNESPGRNAGKSTSSNNVISIVDNNNLTLPGEYSKTLELPLKKGNADAALKSTSSPDVSLSLGNNNNLVGGGDVLGLSEALVRSDTNGNIQQEAAPSKTKPEVLVSETKPEVLVAENKQEVSEAETKVESKVAETKPECNVAVATEKLQEPKGVHTVKFPKHDTLIKRETMPPPDAVLDCERRPQVKPIIVPDLTISQPPDVVKSHEAVSPKSKVSAPIPVQCIPQSPRLQPIVLPITETVAFDGTLTLDRRRSSIIAPITLPGAQEAKEKSATLPGTLKHGEKISVSSISIPKPVIEVKLVKNERSLPSTPKSRLSSPRSTPPRASPRRSVCISEKKTDRTSTCIPENIPEKTTFGKEIGTERISHSMDDLDLSETVKAEVIYSSTNMLRDKKTRHSFVDRNRDSIYAIAGAGELGVTSEYHLPEPQCYSDNTLKAVKQITEKYDTLQRRKLRAMSFRENSKFSPLEPGCPLSQAALWNLKVETVPGPVNPGNSGTEVADEVDNSGGAQAKSVDETVYVTSGITAQDVSRIDLFYRGRETEVIVCSCLADLRVGVPSGDGKVTEWDHLHTGVPVFVLNTGLYKRRRELVLILAERDTGFPLWQDKITYLTNYKEVSPNCHAMHVSNQLRKMVGLTFYCEVAAADFLARFRQMTSDPNDDLWKVSSGKLDKVRKKIKKIKFKRPNKKEISQPCNFSHITRVDPHMLYDSFNNIGGPKSPSKKDSSRPRLQTA